MNTGDQALKNSAILLVECPDQKGLDAAIADFIFRLDGNFRISSSTRPAESAFTSRAWSGIFVTQPESGKLFCSIWPDGTEVFNASAEFRKPAHRCAAGTTKSIGCSRGSAD
jgi:formyltetrahydrofolate hydrolase